MFWGDYLCSSRAKDNVWLDFRSYTKLTEMWSESTKTTDLFHTRNNSPETTVLCLRPLAPSPGPGVKYFTFSSSHASLLLASISPPHSHPKTACPRQTWDKKIMVTVSWGWDCWHATSVVRRLASRDWPPLTETSSCLVSYVHWFSIWWTTSTGRLILCPGQAKRRLVLSGEPTPATPPPTNPPDRCHPQPWLHVCL